jgi:hypothetical protein
VGRGDGVSLWKLGEILQLLICYSPNRLRRCFGGAEEGGQTDLAEEGNDGRTNNLSHVLDQIWPEIQ